MHDLPPQHNQPAPCDATNFIARLTAIGGLTDTGLPHLRLVWGQARRRPLASVYMMAGNYHLKYRHHVNKTKLFALPVHGLDGKLAEYEIFDSVDVIPIDGRVIGQFWMKEDIGIPRWFVEQALAIDPLEWEFQRYLALMRRDLDPGPCPDGGLVYEEMYCVALHYRCCDSEGKNERRRRCYGQYRDPSDVDLTVLRAVEAKMRATEGWTGNEGWRNPIVAQQVARAVLEHRDQDNKREEAEERETEYLMASQLRPHSRRLTGDNHGLDNEKYKFVPSAYKRIRRKKRRGRNATTNTDVQQLH